MRFVCAPANRVARDDDVKPKIVCPEHRRKHTDVCFSAGHGQGPHFFLSQMGEQPTIDPR